MKRRLCDALRADLSGQPRKLPEGGAIVWNAFQRLSRARSCGPMGPNPIAYADIAAWCQLTRTPLEPHHVEAIRAMDEIWMERAYARRDMPDGVKVLPPASEQAMTAEMFDLLG